MKQILKNWLEDVLSKAGKVCGNSAGQNIAVNLEEVEPLRKEGLAETIDDYYARNIKKIKHTYESLGKELYGLINIIYVRNYLREIEFFFNKKLFSVLRSSDAFPVKGISDNIIDDIRSIFNIINDYISLGYLKVIAEEENMLLGESIKEGSLEEASSNFFMPFMDWVRNITADVYNEKYKPLAKLDMEEIVSSMPLFGEELSRKLTERTMSSLDILRGRTRDEALALRDILNRGYYRDADLPYQSFMKFNMSLLFIMAKESAELNIAEKIKAEKRFKRIADFNAAMAQINHIISQKTCETEMLKSVCEIAVRYARLKVAYIGRPDDDGIFRFIASYGETGILKDALISINPDIPEGIGTFGTAWRKGKMQYSNSFLKSPNLAVWKELAECFGIRSVAALPIYRAGKIWGLFAVYHEEENIFDEDLISLLEETAKDISRGLDGIDALTIEHELLSTQEALLNNTVAGIIVTDSDRHMVNVNQRTVEMFGYDSENELLGQSSRMLYPNDEEYRKAGETYRNIPSRGKTSKKWIFNFIHKDETLFWVEISASSANIKGKAVTIWTFYDITDRKLLEDKLKESEEMFRALVDNMPVGLDMHKEKFIYANPALQDMLGYSESELKSMRFWDILAEEHKKLAKNAIRAGVSDINYKHYVTFKVFKKSGEELWVYIYAGSVRYKGEIVRIASFIDITEMVDLRKKLEQERDLLNVLIENIHSGITLCNRNKFLYANLALLDLFNYTKEKFLSLSPVDFFSISEDQIYNLNCGIFQMHRNKEISSRIIYKYIKDSKPLYIDLFRTATIYNNEYTGLAIFSDVTSQIINEQSILTEKETYKELSERDALMGINNRRSFDYKLAELLQIALRYIRPLSLIMFDIDHFKNINDTYGHETGDIILKGLSVVISENLRTTDFFARYGGEEFMVIAPETPISTAKELAERLRLMVEKHDFKIGIAVTCSFGITGVKPKDKPERIVQRADAALYEAKNAGRNRIACR
jgi:diguanylate cyclase (GGDEF)-like protein/PAS domain S-box-containing protein